MMTQFRSDIAEAVNLYGDVGWPGGGFARRRGCYTSLANTGAARRQRNHPLRSTMTVRYGNFWGLARGGNRLKLSKNVQPERGQGAKGHAT